MSCACRCDHCNLQTCTKKIYTDNPDLLEAPDNFGRTPLMYCVLSDRLDCAKSLLKMKSDLHQVDKAGRSALHLAAHKVVQLETKFKILWLCSRTIIS